MVSSSADFVISGPFSAFSLLLLFSHGQRVLQRQLGRQHDRRQIAHLPLVKSPVVHHARRLRTRFQKSCNNVVDATLG